MGRKPKVSYEDKLQACEDYINGIDSALEIAKRLGLGKGGSDVVRLWAKKYQEYGEEALRPRSKNNSYTKEFKRQVVEEYLAGNGSLEMLAIKYQIPSNHTIRDWIKKYNRLEELEDYDPKPEVYTKMAYRKQTTREERKEIVQYCIEQDNDYKGTAEKYDVSYAQVYSWVKKYRQRGEEGLEDKRGRRKEESELSEVEKLQRQNRILEAKIRELEMEKILLKKVQEIERRRSSQRSGKK